MIMNNNIIIKTVNYYRMNFLASISTIDSNSYIRYTTLTITGVELLYNSHFGHGSGPILFMYLNCGGTESRLSDCSYSSYTFGATHSRDAGVRCQRASTTSKPLNLSIL